ncbi:MAG: GTP cyclohydrolase II [Deltaproteobacteria bacterium]|nr:GTP cyclohydrolase II [Deltaproteobacteria bacterium]
MFSYIDGNVRRLLEEKGKIRTVEGRDGVRLSVLGPIPMPVLDKQSGQERILGWYLFVRRTELEEVDRISRELRVGRPDDLLHLLTSYMAVNSLLVHGQLQGRSDVLVRVHSCCMTGDVFGSMRCECGPQLQEAYHRIFQEEAGAVVYMASHEGRGIGLWAKGVTYLLQDMGQDTYQANESLGLPADSRDFSDAAVILAHFLDEGASVRLLSNNPMKVEHLERGGVKVSERIPIVSGVCHHNIRYLHAKQSRGHTFGDDELPED